MKIHLKLLLSLITVLLTGCEIPHYYYSSNAMNVPLFDDKNQLTGLIAGSFGEVNNSFEAQAGFSTPWNIAFTGSLMTGGIGYSDVQPIDKSRISYIEGAGGFYKTFGDIGIFEIFGGYGKGKESHTFTYVSYDGFFNWTRYPDGNANIAFSKIFAQPDIGVRIKWLEAAFSLRITNIDYTNVSFDNTVYHLDALNDLIINHSSMLVEPAFTVRAGFKNVKSHFQIVITNNLSNPDQLYEKARFNFGLSFNIPLGRTKKEQVSPVQ